MQRICLGIEYDGSLAQGWQQQESHVTTVQAVVEAALAKIANHPVSTICGGRTDAGVHALEQIIHFDTKTIRPIHAWKTGTNTHLPPWVRVLWAKDVSTHFSARRSAFARHYRYVIANRETRPGLFRQFVTPWHRHLAVESMQAAAQHWIGEHDFTSFRSINCQSHSAMRKVRKIQISRLGDIITFDIIANAFLHHMVRNMIGVLIPIGEGKKPVDWSLDALVAKDRRSAGITAPSSGLFLVKIQYPDAYQLPNNTQMPFFMTGIPHELV